MKAEELQRRFMFGGNLDRDEVQVLFDEIELFRSDRNNALLKLRDTKQEVERLTTENTYHSLQLDRAKEEIERLRGALVGGLS